MSAFNNKKVIKASMTFGVLWFGMFAVADAWAQSTVQECALDLKSSEPVMSLQKICIVTDGGSADRSIALLRVDGQVDVWTIARVEPLAPVYPFRSSERSSLLVVQNSSNELQRWISTVDAEGRLLSMTFSYGGFTVGASGWAIPSKQVAQFE